eukprot:SAG31_NODE_502_length_14826_cov_5.474299_6_plen_564_part_00
MISATPVNARNVQQPVIGETSPITLTTEWTTVELLNWYRDPVVILGPPTSRAADPVVARVQNVSHGGLCIGWCFQAKLQEPCPVRNTADRGEALSYIVFEKGSYLTDEGAMFQIGSTSVEPSSDFTQTDFNQPFPADGNLPVVFSQAMTMRDSRAFLKSRQRRPDRLEDARKYFSVKLESEMGGDPSGTPETVGWFATQESIDGHMGSKVFEALTTPAVVTDAPYQIQFQTNFGFRPQFLASISTFNGADSSALRLIRNPDRESVTLKIEEDRCATADQQHPRAEKVSFWAMAEHGIVQATSLLPPTCEGVWDAAEAELVGARIDRVHSGHYGAGFVDFIHSSDDTITWTVTPCRAGAYTLIFGYGLESGDRPLDVFVNDQLLSGNDGLPFPSTGAWTAWGETQLSDVTLRAGPNFIKITPAQVHRSGANIDYLAVVAENGIAGERALGESGSLGLTHDWVTVQLAGSYSEDTMPVILASIPTRNGHAPTVVRVRNVRHRDPEVQSSGASDGCLGWCFDMRLAEPDCNDDRHYFEEVSWLAADPGTYKTDDGVLIQVGIELDV